MQIYVKSAGYSVNQDYSWVAQGGGRADIPLSTLAYNVDGVSFVWKSTSTKIYLFANSFVDPTRTDLYNRPIRNYILLEGDVSEADFMYDCFEKMLLDQSGFTSMLSSSVRNAGGGFRTGFSVDFGKISDYFAPQMHRGREICRMRRYLYENDSYEGRRKLLDELLGAKRSPLTLIVGGELSGMRLKELAPDRALLKNIKDIDTQGHPVSDNPQSAKWDKRAVASVALGALAVTALAVTIASLTDKDD